MKAMQVLIAVLSIALSGAQSHALSKPTLVGEWVKVSGNGDSGHRQIFRADGTFKEQLDTKGKVFAEQSGRYSFDGKHDLQFTVTNTRESTSGSWDEHINKPPI